MTNYFIIGLLLSLYYTMSWILNITTYTKFGVDIYTIWNHRIMIVFAGFGFDKLCGKILSSLLVSFFLMIVWPLLVLGWLLYSIDF